ncbi:MAG: aldo/keto reductase [Acidimicrobiales bacterium]
MDTRRLGANGPVVAAMGLGCMGMSGVYGSADEDESVATIHAALDAGVTLLDTGDFYGMGHNELLIREALRGRRRDQVVLSVKCGALRGPDGRWGGQDGRPEALWNFLAYSLQRLGTDHLDVYRPARVDPAVPFEETVGAIGDMVTAGYVRHVGVSEIGADTLRKASAVHPIGDLQIEYSLLSRNIEASVLPTCRELGIGVTAYGILSRGLLSGHWRPDRSLEPGDFRARAPRFHGANLAHNLALVDGLDEVARERGLTVAQAAVAWVLAQGDDIVPLVGAKRRDQLEESLAAAERVLGPDDLAAIETAVPADDVMGTRYPEPQMAHLDSERST